MNYDQPRQIADGKHAGKWQYTTANRRTGTHPTGYCWAPGVDSDPEDPETWPMHYHDTEQEARECYGLYLRDHIRLQANGSSWTSCNYPECENPARNLAQDTVGGWHLAVLCDTHFNIPDAQFAMGITGPAGDSMHS